MIGGPHSGPDDAALLVEWGSVDDDNVIAHAERVEQRGANALLGTAHFLGRRVRGRGPRWVFSVA